MLGTKDYFPLPGDTHGSVELDPDEKPGAGAGEYPGEWRFVARPGEREPVLFTAAEAREGSREDARTVEPVPLLFSAAVRKDVPKARLRIESAGHGLAVKDRVLIENTRSSKGVGRSEMCPKAVGLFAVE